MNREIVHLNDGSMWVIEGEPGAYVARPVGEPVGAVWKHKYELRSAILRGKDIG